MGSDRNCFGITFYQPQDTIRLSKCVIKNNATVSIHMTLSISTKINMLFKFFDFFYLFQIHYRMANICLLFDWFNMLVSYLFSDALHIENVIDIQRLDV